MTFSRYLREKSAAWTAACRARSSERHQEGRGPPPGQVVVRAAHEQIQRDRGQEQHVVDPDEQRQAQRGTRERTPGGVAALVPVEEREQRQEDEELRHRLGHGVPREPHLHDVRGEQQGSEERRAAPKRRRSTKNTPSVPSTPKTGGVASAPFTPIDWKR